MLTLADILLYPLREFFKQVASAEFGIRYHVPIGAGSFKANVTGSASDVCGTIFTYCNI
jgi:hypothetical protein